MNEHWNPDGTYTFAPQWHFLAVLVGAIILGSIAAFFVANWAANDIWNPHKKGWRKFLP